MTERDDAVWRKLADMEGDHLIQAGPPPQYVCRACRGHGYVDSVRCVPCNGSGIRYPDGGSQG